MTKKETQIMAFQMSQLKDLFQSLCGQMSLLRRAVDYTTRNLRSSLEMMDVAKGGTKEGGYEYWKAV
jgi:hypothetical protein